MSKIDPIKTGPNHAVRATRPAAAVARRGLALAVGLAAVAAGAAVPAAAAVVVPFTEDFTAGSANWRQNTSSLDVPQVATGGPAGAGDAYIAYARNLGTSTSTQVTFRGQSSFNASNGAFVGDWLAAGITEFSFWVKHDAPAPLSFGTRFAAAANFPGFSIFGAATVPANQWTKLTVAIRPDNPGWQNEGAGATVAEGFNTIFTAVGNVQVFAARDASVSENTTVTFGLDKVQIVPEPTGLSAVGGAAVAGLLARRRRATARAR